MGEKYYLKYKIQPSSSCCITRIKIPLAAKKLKKTNTWAQLQIHSELLKNAHAGVIVRGNLEPDSRSLSFILSLRRWRVGPTRASQTNSKEGTRKKQKVVGERNLKRRVPSQKKRNTVTSVYSGPCLSLLLVIITHFHRNPFNLDPGSAFRLW